VVTSFNLCADLTTSLFQATRIFVSAQRSAAIAISFSFLRTARQNLPFSCGQTFKHSDYINVAHDDSDLIYKVTNLSAAEFKNYELCQMNSPYLPRGKFTRARNCLNMNCMLHIIYRPFRQRKLQKAW
jgi:hypothetical protein